MRIARVEAVRARAAVGGAVHHLRAAGSTRRRSVVVVLHDGEGHVGYGEAAPDELPFY